MFKIVEDRTVRWPVAITAPQDGGGVQKCRVTAHFRMLDDKRFADFIGVGERSGEGDAGILREVLVGWDEGDVRDEADQAQPFSEEWRDRLIGVSYARMALIQAYLEAHGGREAKAGPARRKN